MCKGTEQNTMHKTTKKTQGKPFFRGGGGRLYDEYFSIDMYALMYINCIFNPKKKIYRLEIIHIFTPEYAVL